VRAKHVIGGLAALAVIVGGAWAWRTFAARSVDSGPPTATPTRGEFVVALQVDGTLQSDDAVTVRNGKAGGKLTMIVPDGTIVQAGEVFCLVESRQMEQRETQIELSFKQAQEEIEKTEESAREGYDNAKRAAEQARQDLQLWEDSNRVRIQQAEDQLEFDRADQERLRIEYDREQRLADKGYVAGAEAEIAKAAHEAQRFKAEQSVKDLELRRREIESELRQKRTAVEAAEYKAEVARTRIDEQVEHAKERAEMARKELDKIRESLAETTVFAPRSGVVALFSRRVGGERRASRAGDQISPGTPLGTISGSENMSVWCRAKETNIGSVWKEQQAEIDFEALAGRVFSGTVTSVAAVAREVGLWEDPNAAPNERVFDVWVKVAQDRPGRLKPGLNASVQFIVKRIPDALCVPLEAVFEREGKSLVYVKRDGQFAAREVTVGDRNDVAVVIRSGLRDNEIVAMADPTRQSEETEKAA